MSDPEPTPVDWRRLPRKAASARRSKRLCVPLTEAEAGDLRLLAESAGESIPDCVSRLVAAELRRIARRGGPTTI